MLRDRTETTAFSRFAGPVVEALRETVFPELREVVPTTILSDVRVVNGAAAVKLRLALNRRLHARLPEGSVFMMMRVGELCALLGEHAANGDSGASEVLA